MRFNWIKFYDKITTEMIKWILGEIRLSVMFYFSFLLTIFIIHQCGGSSLHLAHHVLSLEHLLHEVLLLILLLKVTLVHSPYFFLKHGIRNSALVLLGSLEDRVFTPQTVHWEYLGVGLSSRWLKIGVDSYLFRWFRSHLWENGLVWLLILSATISWVIVNLLLLLS